MSSLYPGYINNTSEDIQFVKEEIQRLEDAGLKDETEISDLQSQLSALSDNTASEIDEDRYPTLNLSKEDSLAILTNLKKPDKANEQLRSAFRDYQQSVSSKI